MKEWIERARPLASVLERLPIIPQGGGILLSEMLLYVTACIYQKVERVVESGRKAGYSTEILHSFPWTLASIERQPDPAEEPRIQQSCHRANLLIGNGEILVPQYVSGRCAILLDGPKGDAAVTIFRQVKSRVVLCGIHDTYATDTDGSPRPFRRMLEAEFPHALWSDDPDWLAAYAYLDQPYWSWGNNYRSREEMVRNGFTLTVIPGGQWT